MHCCNKRTRSRSISGNNIGNILRAKKEMTLAAVLSGQLKQQADFMPCRNVHFFVHSPIHLYTLKKCCKMGRELTLVRVAVASGKIKQRKRAVRALQNHTASTIQALKEDDDEMLRGIPPFASFTTSWYTLSLRADEHTIVETCILCIHLGALQSPGAESSCMTQCPLRFLHMQR